jgi:hypothetical protein
MNRRTLYFVKYPQIITGPDGTAIAAGPIGPIYPERFVSTARERENSNWIPLY